MAIQHPLPPSPPNDILSRWSRRKEAVRQGLPVAEPELVSTPTPAAPQRSHALGDESAMQAAEATGAAAQDDPSAQPKALTLADTQSLDASSDFVPFMARGVMPQVRNAAMKKLFADPHYNVMDGLDIYIDDYSKTLPLPVETVKQMVSARFLGLFEEVPPLGKRHMEAAGIEVASLVPTTPPANLHARPLENAQADASKREPSVILCEPQLSIENTTGPV